MFRHRSHVLAIAALGLAASSVIGQAPRQVMDEDFARAVKEWTTRPEFLNPLVDHLPKSAAVPSPADGLGAHIGKTKVLHYTAQIYGYLRQLEAKSPRVKLATIGRTEEGKEILVAFISSEDNIRNLEQNRDLLARLGDPRGTSEAEAAALIAKAKPVYHITAGIHAAETGPPEMLSELAYRLVAEDSDLVRNIRENVIVALTPVTDPDGRDRVVDWYLRHKKDSGVPPSQTPGPPYWGKYVYHDNNRDINYSGFSGAAHQAFQLRWRPTVMHDLHESMPYLYIYSGYSARDPGLDPILLAEMYWFSNYQKMQLVGYGMPGVWDHGTWDIWWPGYFISLGAYHNALVQMYETFGNGGPETVMRDISPPKPAPGAAATPWFLAPDYTARDWRRPLPAYREVLWSPRNNINYMQTGVLSALGLTAAHGRTVLENFYRRSRNSIAEGAEKAPHAFVFPVDQKDLTRVAFVVNCLRRQGIEVGEATAAVTLKEGSFPAGSLVVKLDQPFGRLARVLLETQVYDADSKKLDDTAWTMGLMSHSRVVPIADRAVLRVPVRPVERYSPRGTMPAAGAPFYAVLDHGSIHMATLRFRLGAAPVQAAARAFTEGGMVVPAGSWIVPGTAHARLQGLVEDLGLTAVALAQAPPVTLDNVPVPRLAVFSTWGSTQDVGWVRYGLDQSDAVYDLIFKEQVRAGNLRSRYDVIVIPSQGERNARGIVADIPAGKPLPYTQTAEFPSLGMYGSSPDIRGGMGEEGLRELHSFVEQGGTLITLGGASELPVAFGWVRGIETVKPSAQFHAIGPIVEAQVAAPESPLFYGYGGSGMPVRWASSTLYAVAPTAQAEVLMRFKGTPDALLSGECIGIAETAGRPAIIRATLGQGQLLMFATNPMFRHQNVGEYRLLFNAILTLGSKARK